MKFFSNAHITVFQGAGIEFVPLSSYILKDWQTCPAGITQQQIWPMAVRTSHYSAISLQKVALSTTAV